MDGGTGPGVGEGEGGGGEQKAIYAFWYSTIEKQVREQCSMKFTSSFLCLYRNKILIFTWVPTSALPAMFDFMNIKYTTIDVRWYRCGCSK